MENGRAFIFFRRTGDLVNLTKLCLDNNDCEFVQMGSIMSAAGDFFKETETKEWQSIIY